MAAAQKNPRLNLMFTLESLDVPSRHASSLSKHVLTVDLIWPRATVAKRSSVLTVPLVRGRCDTSVWSLTNRLCFKEPCEALFGMHVSVTEPVTATKAANFVRYLAAHSLNIAGDLAGDAIPGKPDDDFVALPFTYLYRQLLGADNPDLIAEGVCDVDTAAFSMNEPVLLTVPLVSSRTVSGASPVRRNRGRANTAPSDAGSASCEPLIRKGDADGTATFAVTVF